MSTRHTPGPWHWDSDPIKGDPLGRVRYRVTALGKTVTQCLYSSGDECAEHDARLIAAAPELLAALKGTAHLLMAAALVIEHDESRAHAIRTAAAARAVIAKATGEAP